MQKYVSRAKDVARMYGCSLSKAYEIIRTLNGELEAQGYLVFPGRVPTRYLLERTYTGITEDAER